MGVVMWCEANLGKLGELVAQAATSGECEVTKFALSVSCCIQASCSFGLLLCI